VQLEEFDKRSVEYGLLISTAHYGGRYCDKGKNEIRYNIKVILRTRSIDKVRQNYGTVGRRNGNIDEG
jgi:alpha/beta superfamily hydrolase